MAEPNMKDARYADQILTHYITLAMERSGCNVNSDTYAELNKLIEDAIFSALFPLVRRIEELEAAVKSNLPE